MEPALKPMTADEFLIWRQSQEGTWEFVDGAPRRKFRNPLNMMAGGTRNHALVARNLLVALTPRLKGTRCTPIGSDFALRNLKGSLRQPDVMIECGTGPRGSDTEAGEPRAVFEVLSPSTRGFDLIRKAEEYRQLPTLDHLVILEADVVRAQVWTRAEAGWDVVETTDLGSDIHLRALHCELPLDEIYQDVELQIEED